MTNRLRFAIVCALFFGFIAAYGIYTFLRQQRENTEALKKATQNVVIAAKDIPPGTTLTEKTVNDGLIKVTPWPKDSVPKGSFTSVKDVMGKIAKIKVVAGEPILDSRLSGEGAGLTVRLTPGHRALAVKVDEVIGVSGFLAPDDRVDVIVTVVPPGRNSQEEKISKIVLQNTRVLSVAQNVEQKDGKPVIARSVTLELTPQDAEKLSLATREGEIILALRGIGDASTVATRGSSKRELLGVPAPTRVAVRRDTAPAKPLPSEKPAPPEKYRVEVYIGNEKSVREF